MAADERIGWSAAFLTGGGSLGAYMFITGGQGRAVACVYWAFTAGALAFTWLWYPRRGRHARPAGNEGKGARPDGTRS